MAFVVANMFPYNEHVSKHGGTGRNIRAKPRETRLMDCPSNRTSPRRLQACSTNYRVGKFRGCVVVAEST